jgi:regulator of replication initiation timing
LLAEADVNARTFQTKFSDAEAETQVLKRRVEDMTRTNAEVNKNALECRLEIESLRERLASHEATGSDFRSQTTAAMQDKDIQIEKLNGICAELSLQLGASMAQEQKQCKTQAQESEKWARDKERLEARIQEILSSSSAQEQAGALDRDALCKQHENDVHKLRAEYEESARLTRDENVRVVANLENELAEMKQRLADIIAQANLARNNLLEQSQDELRVRTQTNVLAFTTLHSSRAPQEFKNIAAIERIKAADEFENAISKV